jgi:flagella basal body P-ring formation protein FlgA
MKMILRATVAVILMTLASPPMGWPVSAATGTVLNGDGVRRIIDDYLIRKTALPGVEVRLKKSSFNGQVILPPGNPSYEVISSQEWEGWGRGAVALIVRIDDRVVENIPVNIDVEALADVVVAVRGMERGMVVEKEDVALQKRDLATLPKKTCRDIREVVGKRVRVGVRGNAPIRSDYLEKLPLVRSGKLVSIIAENELFRITSCGIAKGSGAEGDTILVRRESAQKEIPAVVVDAGTVRVEF